MDFFWSTAASLYSFWYDLFSRILAPQAKRTSLIAPPVNKPIDPAKQGLIDVEVLEDVESFKSFKHVVENRPASQLVERKAIPLSDNLENRAEPSEAVILQNNTPLYKRNTKEFDSVIKLLPYGARVEVISEVGQWTQIKYLNHIGWVLREYVTRRVAQARPYFVIKEYCGPVTENTKRLRAMINDVFFGDDAGLPLHPEEYIYYKLFTRGIVLPDVEVRPRTAGVWKDIFKGKSGVHISVRPKTGSVVEYVTAEDVGKLAYVEAVFPDESISLSEVGMPELGYYNERMLSKEVWQAMQPVFIQFS